MIILLHLIIVRLRNILPLEDFRLIEYLSRDIGNCAICENISPRFLITIKIRPTLYQVENSCYYWDQDMYYLGQAVDLNQKVCEVCESLFRSFRKERYFSQMDFLTDIRNARRTLIPSGD